MTGPVDPERLAALLDNRLDPKERDDVLRQLASSEEALEAFSDAAAVLREMEETERQRGAAARPAGGASAPASRRWFRSPAFLAAAAAAIVFAVAIPVALRVRHAPSAGDGTFVAVLADGHPIPATWISQPWSAHRGADAPLSDSARAIRLGASLTDLELSVRARDTTMSVAFADAAASLMADLPTSGVAIDAIRRVNSNTGGSVDERLREFRDARKSAAALVDRDVLEEGSWLEAARIAASRADSAFFRITMSSRAAVRTIGSTDRALVSRAAHAEPADTSTWQELERRLAELLADRAR